MRLFQTQRPRCIDNSLLVFTGLDGHLPDARGSRTACLDTSRQWTRVSLNSRERGLTELSSIVLAFISPSATLRSNNPLSSLFTRVQLTNIAHNYCGYYYNIHNNKLLTIYCQQYNEHTYEHFCYRAVTIFDDVIDGKCTTRAENTS